MAVHNHYVNHVAQPLNVPVPPPIVRPPVVPKQKRVIKQVSVQQVTTRICEWCKGAIPKEALLCPFCKKWRNDIQKARSALSMGFLLSILCLSVIFLVFIYSWPAKSGYLQNVSDSIKTNYPWHKQIKVEPIRPTVEVKKDFSETTNLVLNFLDNHLGQAKYRFEFSMKKFLTSLLGWIVILSFGGFLYSSSMIVQGVITQKKQFG